MYDGVWLSQLYHLRYNWVSLLLSMCYVTAFKYFSSLTVEFKTYVLILFNIVFDKSKDNKMHLWTRISRRWQRSTLSHQLRLPYSFPEIPPHGHACRLLRLMCPPPRRLWSHPTEEQRQTEHPRQIHRPASRQPVHQLQLQHAIQQSGSQLQ